MDRSNCIQFNQVYEIFVGSSSFGKITFHNRPVLLLRWRICRLRAGEESISTPWKNFRLFLIRQGTHINFRRIKKWRLRRLEARGSRDYAKPRITRKIHLVGMERASMSVLKIYVCIFIFFLSFSFFSSKSKPAVA